MSIDTTERVKLNEEQAEAVKNLDRALKTIWDTTIRSNKYLAIVANVKECVTVLGRTHPNWNETTQEPDGVYEDYDLPKGAQPVKVKDEGLTIIDTLITDVVIDFKSARLENPTLDSVNYYNTFRNNFSDLCSYHPRINERNGEIDD